MPAKITLPSPLTKEELQLGLGPARLAELKEVADRLTQNARGRSVDGAVAWTAKQHHVSQRIFCRRFGELARAANWLSTTPADYLTGAPTRRGGYRHGVPASERGKRSLGGAVNEETREAYEAAILKLGVGFEAFIQQAAGHILSGRRFLTVDSQRHSG